jgi:hypothetical protein
MKRDEHDDDERALQALFDATAAEPTQAELDRLARVAARIPEALLLQAPRDEFRAGDPPRPSLSAGGEEPPEPALEPDEVALDEDDGVPFLAELDVDDGDDDELLSEEDPLTALGEVPTPTPLVPLDVLAPPDDDEALAAWNDIMEAWLDDG